MRRSFRSFHPARSGIARAFLGVLSCAVAVAEAAVAAAGVATGAAAAGAPPPLWPAPFDTIRVVARRLVPLERSGAARGFVQVIPLGADAPVSADLGDLLERAAGVRIRRLGGLGAMTFASVRGSSPSQVSVEIDRIPISTAIDGLANLSLIPIRLFDAAEISRGPENGDAAGTIRLATPARLESPLRLRLEGGSFGTASLSGTGGIRRGPISLFAAGGRLTSRGDYSYLDRFGTPYETADDRIVKRENDAFRQDDALVRATCAVSDKAKLDYTGHGLWKDGGIPGTESIQTHRVHDTFSRVLHGLSIDAGRDGRTIRLSAHAQEDRDHFRNPDGEVGLGRADTRSVLTARGLDGSLAASIGDTRATFQLDGSLLDERWRSRDLLFGGASSRDRLTRSIDAGGVVRLMRSAELSVRDRVLRAASPGGSEEVNGRSPRFGGSIDLGGGFGARASYGRFFRLPSFVEMYGQGGVQEGNPSLVPEHGAMWDAGCTLLREESAWRCYAEVVAFGSRTEDAIIWIQNSQRTARPENLERTRVAGCELLLRAALHAGGHMPAVEVTATGTVEDARDNGPSPVYHGRRLPYVPARQGSVDTRLDAGRFALTHRIDIESSLYRDRYNSAEKMRPARTLHDVEGTWRVIRDRLDATIAVRNVTNESAEDVDGFPLPGRSVSGQLTWTVR